MKIISTSLLGGLFLLLMGSGCAGIPARPLDAFSATQAEKMAEATAYVEGELGFWAAAYQPSLEDITQFKNAWSDHAGTPADSRAIKRIEQELRVPGQAVVLVSLFMTHFELADLSSKELGWTFAPAPSARILELDEEVPLRTFFPVRNNWARTFLVRVPRRELEAASAVVVSNRDSRVEIPRKNQLN
jgi:hypothetical protein